LPGKIPVNLETKYLYGVSTFDIDRQKVDFLPLRAGSMVRCLFKMLHLTLIYGTHERTTPFRRFFKMTRLFLLFNLICTAFCLSAQTTLTTVSTKWSDSYVEWELYALAPPDTSQTDLADDSTEVIPEEELFGEFKLRWLNVRDDWSEWDFDLGGERGTIKAKWKDDPTQWELRTYTGTVVTMRTAWSNDRTEWRITDNSVTITLKSRWTNQYDEWIAQDPNRGKFYLYTARRQDPRDWVIQDDLNDSVSLPMKLAMIFVTVFQSSPRE